MRFGISSIRLFVEVELVFVGIAAELEDAEDDESPKTRDKVGKVNVLECPFPAGGPSSLIVSSFLSFSLSLSLSLSGFRRNGRASDGNLRNPDVDVEDDDIEGPGLGTGTGDEVEVETGARFLPKGGSLSASV